MRNCLSPRLAQLRARSTSAVSFRGAPASQTFSKWIRCLTVSGASGAVTGFRWRSPSAGYRQKAGHLTSHQKRPDAGDNAWMLTSSALVLMMTGPGLALFYGGLCARRTCWAP